MFCPSSHFLSLPTHYPSSNPHAVSPINHHSAPSLHPANPSFINPNTIAQLPSPPPPLPGYRHEIFIPLFY